MTNISHAKFHADHESIHGSRDLITGDGNTVWGSYDKLVGSGNSINGTNNTLIGNNNTMYVSAGGGKMFVSGDNNAAYIYKSTDISLHGKSDNVSFVNHDSAHCTVRGFITGASGDFATMDDEPSFTYHGNDTQMSIVVGSKHTDVLFTNAHVTAANIRVFGDPL